MELRPGQVIEGLRGRFEIKRRCGEGGFGLTFEGVDGQGKAVAIKQLRFDRVSDWKALELFEREGKVLAQLAHPSIPAYVDFFAHDGQRALAPASAGSAAAGALSWFLVQQFVQGPSLQQVLEGQGRLVPGQLEEILASLLSTLDYLHSLHPPVIHRDINPKNIVLSPDGRPFLVDFGAIQDRLRFENQQGSTSVGTLGYMPLEQLRGAARPSSDLYALGMTILALASGRSPTEMPVDEATGKVSIAQAAPSLSPRARAALDRMIEPIAGQRVGSAREALALLHHAPLEPAPRPLPVPRPPAPAPPVALFVSLATGLLVVAGGAAALLTLRGASRQPLAGAPVAPVTAVKPAATVKPPTAAPAPAPAPTPEPVTPVSLAWKARPTSPGQAGPCELRLDGGVKGDQLVNPAVVARCGKDDVLYDSKAQLNGTSMLGWDLIETPVSGKPGTFSYALQYSDVGTRVGARAQATIDTARRQAVLFRETVPIYRVTLDVDPASASRTGEAFFKKNR